MKYEVFCNACSKTYEADIPCSVNVSKDPQLKSAVISGDLFRSRCPFCGHRQLLSYPFVYYDSDQKFLVCLSAVDFNMEVPSGFIARRVCSVGDLIEKVKILDAGLDDAVVELCKYVSRNEMKTDADFRFFNFEGFDNSMVFTYPRQGKMELVSINFSVYEECAAIFSRNPSLRPAEGAMELIDRKWVEARLG